MTSGSDRSPPGQGANPLVLRVAAAEAAVQEFLNQPLQYGRRDCARMAAFVLKRLGYHVSLARAGRYTTALGGVRALRRLGYDSLEAALDGFGMARIPLAAALPADIIAVPSEDRWPALWIALSGNRALGWHQSSEHACIVEPRGEHIAVWRAHPRG
jgi:hypothetical protein